MAALLIKDQQDNTLYIEQGEVDANGRFCIPVPDGLENGTIQCNLNGELVENSHILYASNVGSTDGTGSISNPLTFQRALELAGDGEQIIVLDEIILPTDFVWPAKSKSLTVSGKGVGAALNIHMLDSQVLKIGTDTTFENIELASTESGKANGAGTIRAYGNVVTIKESVTTRGIFSAFYGGGRNWDEVAKTESYLYGGNFNRIYGGGGHILNDCKLTVGGNTNTTAGVDPSEEKNGIFEPYIYGGTLDNKVEGDCITTICGNAGAQYLYGGSQDVKEDTTRGSGVKGKTIVNIQGGKFMNVYGMNPPTDAADTSDVTINMTGGTVEALIGSSADTLAASINGAVTINATGGTVTRRIIGGVYNDNGWYSDDNKYITGDVNVVIGPGLQGMTDTQTGHGIFGGSRRNTNPAAENAKLIFVGGSYDTFKTHIDADRIDCDSHHDYLVVGTSGGMILPESGKKITVIPDNEYTAHIGDTEVSGSYTLTAAKTEIVFTSDGQTVLEPSISALSGAVGTAVAEVEVSVTYTAADSTSKLVLALYEGDVLIAALPPRDAAQGTNTEQISIPCVTESGKQYTLRAFLWNGMEDMIPLCGAKDANVTVQ